MTPVTVAKWQVVPVYSVIGVEGALMQGHFESESPAETEAIGARVAAELRPGDVVLIEGELGAGKTTLVRGAARALGIGQAVTSPTFTIGQRYPGTVPVAHLDLYRVPGLAGEDPDLVSDYLRPDTIAFVEWPEGGEGVLGGFARIAARVRLEHAGGDQPPRECRVRILAFDTATRATSVALSDPGTGSEFEARDDPEPGARPGHTARLMPLIVEVLERSGCGWNELDLIAVGTGPGTFTGLRIGVATARALSRAREVPLVGVSTLRVAGPPGQPGGPGRRPRSGAGRPRRAPAGGVRRGLGRRRPGLGSTPSLAAAAISPADLAESTVELGRRRLAVGDGAVEFREVLERPGTLIPADDSELHRVSAAYHCRLAARQPAIRTRAVSPEYLRRPDAELNLRTRS